LEFPAAHKALAVDRPRLDQALVAWAVRQGARLTEGVRVTDLLWEGDRVAGARAGRTLLPARYVVGADGLRSVVGRRLGAPGRGRTPPKVAFTGHWSGVEGLTDRGELHVQGPVVCGIAPAGRPGEANVVLVVPATGPGLWAGSSLGNPWAALQARWPDPDLRRRLANARPDGRPLATGPFDRPARLVHVPGALLAGDAAGYFDPLTGQGLYRALRSAELAAGALHQALTTGAETTAFAAYQQQLQAEFAPAVRRQRYLDALVRRPAALAGALSLATACPPGARWLMGLLGDCTCPKGATLP
ncbi:MAG TPA: NAD(P)/FAD-dependent oxidoreductase, partial [Symbiobacteriaceae bacterium]|nr:NAD(P)/FAD-dependent oxidoreductase [Symbiobacteriaceae bacterium]